MLKTIHLHLFYLFVNCSIQDKGRTDFYECCNSTKMYIQSAHSEFFQAVQLEAKQNSIKGFYTRSDTSFAPHSVTFFLMPLTHPDDLHTFIFSLCLYAQKTFHQRKTNKTRPGSYSEKWIIHGRPQINFSSSHNVHKSSSGLSFWDAESLINRLQ